LKIDTLCVLFFIGFFRPTELKIRPFFTSPWDANDIFFCQNFFMENQLHILVENGPCRSEKKPENVCCKFCFSTSSLL